jgi:hypothetical protein
MKMVVIDSAQVTMFESTSATAQRTECSTPFETGRRRSENVVSSIQVKIRPLPISRFRVKSIDPTLPRAQGETWTRDINRICGTLCGKDATNFQMTFHTHSINLIPDHRLPEPAFVSGLPAPHTIDHIDQRCGRT